MSKKIFRGLTVSFALIVILLIGIYILLCRQYISCFSYGTWVNNVYCTGKTVEEINDILKARESYPVIVINNKERDAEIIYSYDYGYSADFTDSLKGILDKQNPLTWIFNVFKKEVKYDILPKKSYDEDKLYSLLENLKTVRFYERQPDLSVYIYSDEEGFHLFKNEREVLDKELLFDAVKSIALKGGVVDVSGEFTFSEKPGSEYDEVLNQWAVLSDFLKTRIIYDFGDSYVPIDAKVLKNFVEFNEETGIFTFAGDKLRILDDRIFEYADYLFEEYDTMSLPRKYSSYKEGIKEINLVTKGQLIDKEYEKVYLVNAIKEGISEIHAPKYINESFVKGKDDIGPDKIEVDLTNQKLYMFIKHELVLETDIVSGKPGINETPQMVSYIYAKTADTVLKGTDYASHVDYWMPVYKGIGIHDASWQTAFGGERYIEHGSHGCINLKREDAEYIYEHTYIGFPVIIYK